MYLRYTGIAVRWEENIAIVCSEELVVESKGAGDHRCRFRPCLVGPFGATHAVRWRGSRSILAGMHVVAKPEVGALLLRHLDQDGVYVIRPSESHPRQYVISVT